jgi:hypothetical protein
MPIAQHAFHQAQAPNRQAVDFDLLVAPHSIRDLLRYSPADAVIPEDRIPQADDEHTGLSVGAGVE